jgi:SAM-dependent methyltransferase
MPVDPALANIHPALRPRQQTLARRTNVALVYSTLRRAIRECKPAMPILMAPCGYGWYFDRFRKDGIDVVGIDIDHGAVEWARKAVTPPFTIHEGSALEMPFKDGEFDFVISNRFILHFPDEFRGKAMCELARVTRRYLLVHYDYPISFRQLGRKLRGAKEPEKDMDALPENDWRRTQRKERKLYHSREMMAAEGAPAGLVVKKLYFVWYFFSDRVYCLYEKK